MKILTKDEMIQDYELIIESISLVESKKEYEVVDSMIQSYRRKYPALCVNAEELERKLIARINADAFVYGKLAEA